MEFALLCRATTSPFASIISQPRQGKEREFYGLALAVELIMCVAHGVLVHSRDNVHGQFSGINFLLNNKYVGEARATATAMNHEVEYITMSWETTNGVPNPSA